MNILESLVGKQVKLKTDVGTESILEIKEVKHNSAYIETGPSTPENDWWPDGYYKHTYTIFFTNGHSKRYDSLESIDIL